MDEGGIVTVEEHREKDRQLRARGFGDILDQVREQLEIRCGVIASRSEEEEIFVLHASAWLVEIARSDAIVTEMRRQRREAIRFLERFGRSIRSKQARARFAKLIATAPRLEGRSLDELL